MEAKIDARRSLAQIVQHEQLKHASEAARRAAAARDRLIGAVIWFGISTVLPAEWKWAAWLAAFIGLLLACWNWEQSWIERRLSLLGLSPEELRI